jgi:hypothetical protein
MKPTIVSKRTRDVNTAIAKCRGVAARVTLR